MKKIILPLSLSLFCAVLVGGCDLAKPKNPAQNQPVVQENELQQPEAVLQEPEEKKSETVLTKVDANAGTRGQSLTSSTSNPVSIVTVPIKTLFLTADRIQVNLNLERAMKEYKAFNDDKAPASQAEFDEKIIKAYGIKLPVLRPDQKYIYDPTDGELKIEGPANVR